MKQQAGWAKRACTLVFGLMAAFAMGFAGLIMEPRPAAAQNREIIWTEQEKPIVESLHGVRSLPDDERAKQTEILAIEIRVLPPGENKLLLASGLASLSTEGDFGRDTLQDVATTLANALTENPPPGENGGPAGTYLELAQLVRYEHVKASVDSPQFAKAMAQLESDDQKRQHADFTLLDINGKSWELKSLKGKVVLVNFWATWCPPCRKEMPDLEALFQRFKNQGLVVLALSDEDAATVKPFIAGRKITYPVLLDPGRKVNLLFNVVGIPKTFIYDRQGKLVAQTIDIRTRHQFLEMLAQAGLH